MKDLSAIANLRKHFKKDFKETTEDYKNLAQQIQANILSSGRSIKDQLIETQALVDELKSKNFLGEISLAISAMAIIFTILSYSNISAAIPLCFSMILALITIGFIFYSLHIERCRAKRLPYYLLKLRCLKELLEQHGDSTHNPSAISQQDS